LSADGEFVSAPVVSVIVLQPTSERSMTSSSVALNYASRSERWALSSQLLTGIEARTAGGAAAAIAGSTRAETSATPKQLASAIESAAASGRRESMRCERSMTVSRVIPEGEKRRNTRGCDIAKNETGAATARSCRKRPLRGVTG
jgi:hypothetical protein